MIPSVAKLTRFLSKSLSTRAKLQGLRSRLAAYQSNWATQYLRLLLGKVTQTILFVEATLVA